MLNMSWILKGNVKLKLKAKNRSSNICSVSFRTDIINHYSNTMNSTTLLYDNRKILYNLSNITNSMAQSDYLLSSTRFFLYNILRLCQVLIGIPSNIMTLIVINRLRFRLNMHILMIYMAISDISSSATLPIGIYIGAS